MKQLLLALFAGGLLLSAGVLFEKNRSGGRYPATTLSDLFKEEKNGSDDAELYLELARRLVAELRLPDALNYARKAQGLKDQEADAFFLEGHTLWLMGQAEDAIPPLKHAARLKPKLALAHLELGQAYNKTGHLKQAIDEFREYVDLEPEDDVGYYWLGVCAMSAGMFDVAQRSLERAKSLNPQRATTFVALGNLLLLQKPGPDELDRALKHYQSAADLDHTNAEAVELMGTVYYRQKRYGEAAREFERALRIDPTVAEVYYPLGLAYTKLGDRQKAERSLEIARVYAAGKEAFARPGGAVAESVQKRK